MMSRQLQVMNHLEQFVKIMSGQNRVGKGKYDFLFRANHKYRTYRLHFARIVVNQIIQLGPGFVFIAYNRKICNLVLGSLISLMLNMQYIL